MNGRNLTAGLLIPLSFLLLGVMTPIDLVSAEEQGGRSEPLPDELEGIGITEHLNEKIPMDLIFMDENGKQVLLGEYFDGERPVLLNLVYYTCPMLCTLVLNGVVNGMQGLKWSTGEEYVNVTVTIDPEETTALARAKKDTYLEVYGRESGESGWHYLTGSQESITALAEAIGFGYRYDSKSGEFIHTAATFVLTPDGRISRYLYGIEYEQQTLRLALLEASEGRIGNTIDRLILYCFRYDAEAGRYAPVAINIMRIGGILTVIVIALMLLIFWNRETRRRRALAASGGRP